MLALASASSWLTACDGCSPDSNHSEPQPDAAPSDLDGGEPFEPSGMRPVLDDPAELVPLLYGRAVQLEHRVDGATRTRVIPLDDPEDPGYLAFFADLEKACLKATSQELTPPSKEGLLVPGCARDGIYTGMMHACRANVALSFAAEGSEAGLSRDRRGALWLDVGNEGEARVWTASAEDANVRASFAMLSVSELREAVRALAITFDPKRCQGFSGDEAFSTRALPDQAAEALFKSHDVLQQATRASDMWLARVMDERASAADDNASLSASLRASLTRGLNGSLLERQKLFAAVPYGAFAPVEGEVEIDLDPAGRYAALYAPASESIESAVHVLSALRVSPFASDGERAASEDVLARRVFSGLRREVPLVFGGWDRARVDAAVIAIGQDRKGLNAGARHLIQTLRATGSPWTSSDSLDALSAEGMLSVDLAAPGPSGFAFALLEGTASLAAELDDFALRGLAHAQHVARNAARHALEGGELGVRGRGFLTPLADSLGPSATLCRTPSEQGSTAQLSVTGLEAMSASAATHTFELFRGEASVACALHGEIADEPCGEQVGAVAATFDAKASTLRFASLSAQGDVASHRVYLTRRGLVDTTVEGRAIVAAFSLEPFREPKREGCGLLPLSAQLMTDMHAIHLASAGAFTRTKVLPRAETSFQLAATDAVPLAFQRTIGIGDALGEAQRFDVSQPLGATFRDFIAAVAMRCDVDGDVSVPQVTWQGPFECSVRGAAAALRQACVASELATLSGATETTPIGSLSLLAPTDQERLALRLLAFERAELALLHTLDLIDPRRCADSESDEAEERVNVAWPLASALIAQLTREEPLLRTALASERVSYWSDEPDGALKQAGVARDVMNSLLVEARLYVAAPRSAYDSAYGGAGSSLSEALEDALFRFPTVTRPVTVAEDARIEGLLRATDLHPLAPDLALEAGVFVPERVADAFQSGAFTRWLRLRLASEDPKYESLPEQPVAVLNALGVSQAQLESAALRIVEQSETRGVSLLTVPVTTPALVTGLEAPAPGVHAAPLFALSGGRLGSHPSAVSHHTNVQGLFHLLAHAREVLSAADFRSPARDESESTARTTLLSVLDARTEASTFAIEQTPDPSGPQLAVEFALPDGMDSRELSTYAELWWTDAGMRCALSGSVAGEPCDERDYRFGTWGLSVGKLGLPPAGMPERVRMAGFTLPAPVAWDSNMTDAVRRGRVYMTVRDGSERRVVASLSLESGAITTSRVQVPDSPALREALVSILGYRAEGENCSSCTPRSVCETTRCEVGFCVRERVVDGRQCTVTGQCVAGQCDVPGCGDGARSDGTDIPFEACDDGNLIDLDGCSASCEPEVRRIEPAIAEGWPSGPAPALGTDGLGRTLLVYTTDALTGDDVAIRAAAFDAFGAPLGAEKTLEAQLPRGYLAEPSVVGLRDGGFVVAYASPSVSGMEGVAYRFVDAAAHANPAKLIEPSAGLQSQVRIAAAGEGFVAVWRQAEANLGTRLRMRRFDALGEPLGASELVADAVASVDQSAPSIVSSLGQWLVTWSEANATAPLGVYARRFAPDGAARDAAPILVAQGACSEPAAATLASDDYAIAFTDRGTDLGGDIAIRTVRRFGPPLEASSIQPVIATSDAETRPVIVAARNDSFALGYQLGAPLASTKLYAPSLDTASVSLVQTNLARAGFRDLSMASDERGVWLVWSESLAQSRALFVYRLPLESAP